MKSNAIICTETVCKYPEWLEQRMREFRRRHSFNFGQNPHFLTSRETYDKGYMAGYMAGTRRPGGDPKLALHRIKPRWAK